MFTGTLHRKPESLAEARTVGIRYEQRLDEILVLELPKADLTKMDALAAQVAQVGGPDCFLVYDADTEDVYAVERSGYDHVRYLGRLSPKTVRALNTCRIISLGKLGCDEVPAKPEPEAEFSDFEPLTGPLADSYAGTEGEAKIAFIGSPDGLDWQIDLVADQRGLEVSYRAMNGDEATWQSNTPDHGFAVRLGRCCADRILAKKPGPDPLNVDGLTDVLDTCGLRRIV